MRKTNSVSFFKDSDGSWINDPGQILDYTSEFFQKAFQTDHIDTPWKNILNSQTYFDNIDLSDLDYPLKDFGVVRAIFSFKPFKAPGPDGIPPFFYQKYWHVIRNSVLTFCHNIFKNLSVPKTLNSTYICLIPKFHNANNLNNFCPAGLCNTIYKVITKIIFNKIKPTLIG